MQIQFDLTFRNVERTEPIENMIREKVAKLEKICNYMILCKVAEERDQEHQRTGNPYRVRIDIVVPPGHEIVARRESSRGDMHDPLTTVIRDAFDAARRQLIEIVERQRADAKKHPRQIVEALVVKLVPDEGYGFIRDTTGREIYFHRNSVLHGDFERLIIGTGVRFVEEEGEEGPRATSVQVIEKMGEPVVTNLKIPE
jgi:cold shock CspA family protein